MDDIRSGDHYKFDTMCPPRHKRNSDPFLTEEEMFRLAIQASLQEMNIRSERNELNSDISEDLTSTEEIFVNKITFNEEPITVSSPFCDKSIYDGLLQKLKRISGYDKDIKHVHDILQDIIEEYCKHGVKQKPDPCILDIIKTVRLHKDEITLINDLFE